MSYISGFMMGTAIIQGLRQLLGDSAAFDGTTSFSGMGRTRGMGGMGTRMSSNMDFGMPSRKGRSQNAWDIPSSQSKQAQKFSASQPIELVSSLPGRRRYRMAGMSEAQAKLLEEMLGKLPYMKQVTANPISGSLLLLYDETKDTEVGGLVSALKASCYRNVPSMGNEPAPSSLPSFLSDAPHTGSLTRSIRNAIYSFSIWIKRNTGGLLDASSLASLLFFFQGLRKMLLTQQFPSGSQMFWWAISLMRGWRAA